MMEWQEEGTSEKPLEGGRWKRGQIILMEKEGNLWMPARKTLPQGRKGGDNVQLKFCWRDPSRREPVGVSQVAAEEDKAQKSFV